MKRYNLLYIVLMILVLSCTPQTKESSEVPKIDEQKSQQTIPPQEYKKVRLSDKNAPLTWIQAHQGYVYYIDISPDGRFMVTGGSDKYIRVWDISKLPQINEIKSIRRLYQVLWGPPVRFSEDGRYIFSGSYDFIEVFDRDLNFIDNMRISSKGVQSIEVGKGYIFASDVDGFVYKLFFDGKKLELKDKKQIHSDEIWKVKLVYDRYLITASLDKTSKVLDTDSLSVINTLRAHAGPLEFIDSSGKKMALFSADSYISVWDTDFNLLGKIFDTDKKDIIVGIFDRSGKYIISGGKSFKIKIWDSESFELKKTIEWHSNDIMALKVSIDNNFLISGDRDGKIAIWEF